MTAVADLPLRLFTLRDPAVQADPYPFYHRLRTEDPVHWEEGTTLALNRWVLTRYGDVTTALRDPRLSAERNWTVDWLPQEAREAARSAHSAYVQQVIFSDPPDHTRLRRLMLTAFTPRVVEEMRPRIQQYVNEALDVVAPRGQMDVIADLAYPLPTVVIAALLGVPPEDRERLKAWSNDLATTFDGDPRRPERSARAYQGVAAFMEYLTRLVIERRHAPQDNLLQTMIEASDEGDALSLPEVIANAVLLLFAGHETTTNLIGNGLLALLRHPDQLERLRDDPALMTSAVEELLRYDSPVQVTVRVAKENLQIAGQEIDAGKSVFLLLGAANRDPAQYAAPDQLDLARAENRHLAFAYGPHFCLGAALARLEGQIAIGTMLRRWPHLRLVTPDVQWRDNVILRGLVSLPIVLGEAQP
jgi:cytochrome P450